MMQKQDSPEDHGTPKKGIHMEEVSTPMRNSTEKMQKGNLGILRKKLEENRYRHFIVTFEVVTTVNMKITNLVGCDV
jgi:hypothetical protein